jgi:hypothetical protein
MRQVVRFWEILGSLQQEGRAFGTNRLSRPILFLAYGLTELVDQSCVLKSHPVGEVDDEIG